MSSVADMWNGFVVGIVCIIVGTVLAFGVGYANDTVLSALDEAGVYEDTPDGWQDMYDQTTAPAIDLLYLIPYAIILVGILILGLSAFRSRWNRQV